MDDIRAEPRQVDVRFLGVDHRGLSNLLCVRGDGDRVAADSALQRDNASDRRMDHPAVPGDPRYFRIYDLRSTYATRLLPVVLRTSG